MNGQCFECAKNIGNWTDESAIDTEKTIDGIVYLVDSGGFVSSRINKYDFNCNLIWSKNFGYDYNIAVKAVTSDELGNIYIVIHNANNTNGGLGPFNISGFMMSPGLNFYKLNSSGTILWYKNIGPGVGYDMQNIFYYQNQLYVTGTFNENLNFNNNLTFSLPFTNYSRAFIAKYDTDGNLINAINYGNGDDIFKYSEIDNQGNIYLTRSHYNAHNSNIDKFNSSLQLSWSKVLSSSTNSANFGIYTPTGIRFNSENNKLYIWGKMSLTTNIMGNTYFVSNSNGIFQSVLTEFNTTNGNLENIKRFDNSSSYSNSYPSAVLYGRSAYMAEKNGYLYVLTSFRGTIVFPNGDATSTKYDNNNYDSEDLLLFKVKLLDFSTELMFQSYGTSNLSFRVTDLPGNIIFNGDDLYLTSTFGSTPMQINGSIINNNSGNNDPDAMLYKFSINSTSNSGEIICNNTCLNELTNFRLNGNFDSITWDFGDITSINNTSNINNPEHQFSSSGNFHIKANVVCGTNIQIVEKDIVITKRPTLNSINTIASCETISGTGICSQFDTTNINSSLIGSQQNVTIEYTNSNGTVLSSPLPNPYTNSNVGGDIITAKAYFTNNKTCSSETNIEFNTLSRPLSPNTTTPQTFCIQQNATLNSIAITGQNIKWYDALTNGDLLANTTPLQNGITYFASQTINGCESKRVPVLINIQNTATPTAFSPQTFCASQIPTLNNLVITGTNIKWYDSPTLGTVLPISTPLLNGKTYYATQTLSGCESSTRLAVTVALISTLPANNYAELFCDDLNDGTETVNLSSYNSSIISNTTNYSFTYYKSLSGAENETASNKIGNFTNYKLDLGDNQIYVRINSNTPCYAIAEIKLTLFSKPIINIQDIVPICENKTITIDAGAGFDSYLWSNGTTNQTILVEDPGNFWVTVTDDYDTISCSSTKNFTVKKSNKATINTIETKDWTDNDNMITVFATGIGEYEYSIDGYNYQTSNQFTGLISGKYTILVRDKNGCGTATDEVYLLMFPRFFTPNGDGFNDTWKIKFSDIEEGLIVKIFDRYGKLIKTLASNTSEWNGTFNGAELPASDYWFVVTRANGIEYKGHFGLKR